MGDFRIEVMQSAERGSPKPDRAEARVRVLPFAGTDDELLAAFARAHPGAPAALFARYGEHMQRILARILGPDSELADVLHDAVLSVMGGVGRVQSGEHLKAWISIVTVNTARKAIRRRTIRRRLMYLEPWSVPDRAAPSANEVVREEVVRLYRVFERMPTDERIVLALQLVDGREVNEIAELLETSPSTVKRRLRKARRRFEHLAGADPVLREHLEGA